MLCFDPDKNRTNAWLHGLRLQLPSFTTKYSSIGRISYADRFFNIQGTPWLEVTNPDIMPKLTRHDKPQRSTGRSLDEPLKEHQVEVAQQGMQQITGIPADGGESPRTAAVGQETGENVAERLDYAELLKNTAKSKGRIAVG